MKRNVILLIGLFALDGVIGTAEEAPISAKEDPATGMRIGPGWELTRNSCIVCHSANQFLRQRGTRSTWTEIIVWMREKQGMVRLPAESEAAILNYLAANYGPEEGKWRRAPIPATLMPVNPYVSEARREFEALQKQ